MKKLSIALFLILSLTISQAQAIDFLVSGKLIAIDKDYLTIKLSSDKGTRLNITSSTKFYGADDKTSLTWNKFNVGEVVTVAFDPNNNNVLTVKKGPIVLKSK